jgi:P27 family predicted phage terminase small subunit
MGRRGPAREPDAAKLRKGETRPSRLNGLEPLPRHRTPTMPKGMDDTARRVWRRVLRETRGAGIILAADTDVLRCYCEAVAAYERDVPLLMKAGPVITGSRGRELVRNPMHQIVRDDRDAIRLLARELGLSPAARAGLQLLPGAEAPDIDAELGPPPRLRVVGDA